MKQCSKCKSIKSLEEFSIGTTGRPVSICKECIRQYSNRWYQKNKEKINEQRKKYYLNNKEKVNGQKKKYRNKRRRTDSTYRLLCNLRCRIYKVLKGRLKSASTMKLLGCTMEQLLSHLENQFIEGMTRDNHGYYGWHIDHIRPCSSYDLSDTLQQEQCFHYSNLQPLWAEDNIKKSDTYLLLQVIATNYEEAEGFNPIDRLINVNDMTLINSIV